MYPSIYYMLRDLFGVEIPFFRIVNTFGFFVALSFVAAHWAMSHELKRKEKEGLLRPLLSKTKAGESLKPMDYIISGILGFLLGYKFLPLFFDFERISQDMQSYVFSAEGNFIGGLVLAGVFVYFRYREDQALKAQPAGEKVNVTHPWQLMGDMTIIAALSGFLGAKLFHNLENLSELREDPIEALLSFGGFTFFGGLICGAAAVLWYAGKKGIHWRHMLDVGGPAMMIAYGVGRIGCQMSGDGDWGILNSAYKSNPDGTVAVAGAEDFQAAKLRNAFYYLTDTASVQSLDHVPHKAFKAPSFLPEWAVAYTYPNNVLSEGVRLQNCNEEKYCSYLPIPVFPTPLYEAIMGIALFLVLWSIRKKLKIPGQLFAIYMILAGLERFFIEKIRVNTTIDYLPFQPTQAELISLAMIFLGVFGLIWLQKNPSIKEKPAKVEEV